MYRHCETDLKYRRSEKDLKLSWNYMEQQLMTTVPDVALVVFNKYDKTCVVIYVLIAYMNVRHVCYVIYYTVKK